ADRLKSSTVRADQPVVCVDEGTVRLSDRRPERRLGARLSRPSCRWQRGDPVAVHHEGGMTAKAERLFLWLPARLPALSIQIGTWLCPGAIGAPGGIRPPGPLLRRQPLCPAELQAPAPHSAGPRSHDGHRERTARCEREAELASIFRP